MSPTLAYLMDRASSLLPEEPALTDAQAAEQDEVSRVDGIARAERAGREMRDSRRALLLDGGCRRASVELAFADELEDSHALLHAKMLGTRGIWVLAGGVGCGKTLAATWWLDRYGGHDPVFFTAERFEARGRYDREFRDQWESATGIVIDDLGAEYGDEKRHFLVGLDALIDHAIGEQRGMVITTNLGVDDFGKRYGARIVSRIRNAGGFYSCSDGDRRADY